MGKAKAAGKAEPPAKAPHMKATLPQDLPGPKSPTEIQVMHELLPYRIP